jgi:geranylgeranyl transferase type-2 subunit beta
MDLFDSATPEMKRMRNQRKDSSILDQMMATSTGVEPTEVVYHLDGKVSHSRDIFGPLSTENSPVSSQRLALFANAMTNFCRTKSTILPPESASLARLRHYLTSVSMPPAFEHHDPRKTLLLERHGRAHLLPCNLVIRHLIRSCKLHLSTLLPALVRDTFQVQKRMRNSA